MKKKRLRALAAMLCLAVFGCTLSGCAADAASRQLDFDEWTTWDISTPLSLSADYFLTEYTDADKIWRYDSASDCLMSMRYGYSDAIAIDSLYALSMLAEQSDLELCPEPIGTDSIVAYVTNSRADVQQQMNEYIPVYRSSEAYADLVRRANIYEFVPDTEIPVVEDGPILRVAIDTSFGNYPYTYYDFVSGEPQGVDIEFIKYFAAEYGYTVEWFDGSWDACSIAVTSGEVDVFVCAISQYYAEGIEFSQVCLSTDPYYDLELVLIVQKGSLRQEGES